MLAKANRLVTADDYRAVLRRGSRRASMNTVVSIARTGAERPARFGFIVTKKVGNAVKRNQIRRRMKAIAWELVDGGLTGTDVVVRALPASSKANWVSLHSEIVEAVDGGARR